MLSKSCAGYGLVIRGNRGQRLCSNQASLHISVEPEYSTERYKRDGRAPRAEFAAFSGTCTYDL